MLKYLFFIFMAACHPELEDTFGAPPVEIGGETDSELYPWATWDTCAHNVGDHPCNFSLMDQNEEIVELYQYHGKVIVVDLSTMWCSICNNIATKGDEWVAAYGEDDFIWITVLIEDSIGESPSLLDLQLWSSTYGIDIPVLAGDRSMIDLSARTGYPCTGWPTLVVIDQEMVLQYGINGWNEGSISGWVEKLL
jgi:hypothetical protein